MKFPITLSLLLVVNFAACNKKAEGIKELSGLMGESTLEFQKLNTEFQAVKDPAAAATVMQKFIDTVRSLKDRGEGIRARYPELAKQKDMPQELRDKMVAYLTAAQALEREGMGPIVEKYGKSPQMAALQQKHPEYFKPKNDK